MTTMIAPTFDGFIEFGPVGIDKDFATLRSRQVEAIRHYAWPVSQTSIRRLFAELAATWKEETAFSSSIDEIVLNSSYQQIIGLGRATALPLILESLQRETAHWFWALHALTGLNPVPDADAGNIEAMSAHWLRWGRSRGLID